MDLRQLVRGTVEWPTLEAIGAALAERSDRDVVRIEFLAADNWLSTPLVVDDQWFVKVITQQNVRVHSVMTGARNLGAFTSGTEGFFRRYDGPLDMARHEIDATERMHDAGLNVPEPVEAFALDGVAVVVLEYLADFHTLDEHPERKLEPLAAKLFDALADMHAQDIAHGDLGGDNVLVVDDEPYFIDATFVREGAIDDARAYDLASALSVLAPKLGARRAVELAVEAYDPDAVLEAARFVDFVNFRPDHEFDVAQLKGEIEKAATR